MLLKKKKSNKARAHNESLMELRRELHRHMPDIEDYGDKDSKKWFWQRQWEFHGTQSGLDPKTYFETALELYNSLPNFEGI